MTTTHPLYDGIISLCISFKSINIIDLLFNGPKYYTEWWANLYREAPSHILVETSLVLFILWLLFVRKTVDPAKTEKNPKLSKEEVDMLIETWKPEPLVPDNIDSVIAKNQAIPIVEGVKGNYAEIRGVQLPVLNLATFDFLGLSQRNELKAVSQEALEKYGCGSCGPRGFYGTIDQHLNFETAIANFMCTADAISYSDGSLSGIFGKPDAHCNNFTM